MVVQPVADSALPIQLSAFLIIDDQGDSASKKLVFWIAVSHSVDSVFVILSGHSCFLSNIFQGFSENRVTVSIPSPNNIWTTTPITTTMRIDASGLFSNQSIIFALLRDFPIPLNMLPLPLENSK